MIREKKIYRSIDEKENKKQTMKEINENQFKTTSL